MDADELLLVQQLALGGVATGPWYERQRRREPHCNSKVPCHCNICAIWRRCGTAWTWPGGAILQLVGAIGAPHVHDSLRLMLLAWTPCSHFIYALALSVCAATNRFLHCFIKPVLSIDLPKMTLGVGAFARQPVQRTHLSSIRAGATDERGGRRHTRVMPKIRVKRERASSYLRA